MNTSCKYKKRITFIIRSYYRPHKLARVLNSIANLNYKKELIDIIIVLDAKDNDSLNNIYKFKMKYKDIKIDIIKIDENSATKAWNIGILNAKSPIVAILPDDVVLHKDIICYALDHLEDPKVAVVGFPVTSSNPALSEKLHHWRYLGRVYNNVKVIMPISFFKKNILMKVGLYREDMGPPYTIHEDWELGSRIVKNGYKIVVDGRLNNLHLVSDDIDEAIGLQTGTRKHNSIISRYIKLVKSYARSYIDKHWWSFLQVIKVSPITQLLEYIFYYFLGLLTITLLVLHKVSYLLFILLILIIAIIVYSMLKKYYSRLSLKERIVYPILLIAARAIRAYMALIAIIYNLFFKRSRESGINNG